jgi:hypothetical protein
MMSVHLVSTVLLGIGTDRLAFERNTFIGLSVFEIGSA